MLKCTDYLGQDSHALKLNTIYLTKYIARKLLIILLYTYASLPKSLFPTNHGIHTQRNLNSILLNKTCLPENVFHCTYLKKLY